MIITIDGPAGSGKTTTAKYFAEHYTMNTGNGEESFSFISSGLFYRAVTYTVLQILREQKTISENDLTICVRKHYREIVQSLSWSGESVVSPLWRHPREVVLHSPDISAHAASVSQFVPLRETLNETMRTIISHGNWIIEGRDAGTHIAPDAVLKIYLDVPAGIRAERRFNQYNRANGNNWQKKDARAKTQNVFKDIDRRDAIDKNKGAYSLRAADEAVYINSTYETVEQICDNIYNILTDSLR